MGEKKRRISAGGALQGTGDLSMQALELLQSGRRDEALALYRRLMQGEVSHPEALHRLAFISVQFGEPARAVTLLDRALARNAGNPYLHNTRGIALRRLGRWEEAEASLRRAIDIEPGLSETWNNLGNTLLQTGRFPEAFTSFRTALSIAPQVDSHWAGYGEALSRVTLAGPFDENFRTELARALSHRSISPGYVSRTARAVLRDLPDFSRLLDCAGATDPAKAFDDCLAEPAGRTALSHPLLLRLLEALVVPDPDMEILLTAARRFALARSSDAATAPPLELETLCAIARQCYLVEYGYAEGPECAAQLAELAASIESDETGAAPWRLAVFGMFRPLSALKNADILATTATGPLLELFRQQLFEPREEARLKTEIRGLSVSADPVSNAVQAQYEANPYPPWTRTTCYDDPRPMTEFLGKLFPHARFRDPESKPLKVLVAGCGTGFHPVSVALRFSNVRVIAVDLSLSSLAYAIRKTREHGIRDIEYWQGNILSLPDTLGPFDLIESIGVLHHLRDPVEGWRKLLSLLAPHGLMRIGLYSQIARKFLDRGKAMAAARGQITIESLRSLRAQILADRHDPDMAKICALPDFYSLSGSRDLLAHVQEHQFTLPQVSAVLERLNLEFIGFEFHDSAVAREFRSMLPGARIDDLAAWHEFELARPSTFIGMYEIWVRRHDAGKPAG